MLREKVSKGLEPAQRAPKAHTEEKERGPPSSHWPSLAYSGAPRQVLGQLGGGGGGGCDGGDGELDDERTPVTSQTMNISDCQTLPKSVILCSMHSAQRGMRAVDGQGKQCSAALTWQVPSDVAESFSGDSVARGSKGVKRERSKENWSTPS